MLGLGTFAVSNFVVSGTGYALAEEPAVRRFHEMNMMWNTVNLGLAVPGYLKARKQSELLSWEALKKEQQKTERIFLINGGLDLGYIAAGLWMQSEASQRPDQADLYTGYGQSLVFQGAFLLAFDTFAYYVHHRHARQSGLFSKVSFSASPTGINATLTLD